MSFIARVRLRVWQSVKDRGWSHTLLRTLSAPYYLAREYVRWRASFDARYGVDTEKRPLFEANADETEYLLRGGGYEPIKPELFRKAVESLPIHYEDFTFVDLGAGKGRALLLASEFPFREIVGIELGPELHKVARQNVLRYRAPTQKCNSFQLIEADFTNCALPPGSIVIYLFNPCREPEMRKLVANIKERLLAEPREAYILYLNPVLGHVIDEAQFMTAVGAGNKWVSYRYLNSGQMPVITAA